MHYFRLLHPISDCCELCFSLICSLLPILTSASLVQLLVISSSGYCHSLLTGQSSCLCSPLFLSPFHTTAARVFQNYKSDHLILYSDLYNRFPLPLTSMAWEGLRYLKPVCPSPLVGVCVLPLPVTPCSPAYRTTCAWSLAFCYFTPISWFTVLPLLTFFLFFLLEEYLFVFENFS